MGKLTELDWNVAPGVDTVMVPAPGLVSKLAAMVAVNCVELTKVVGSGVMPHMTVQPEV